MAPSNPYPQAEGVNTQRHPILWLHLKEPFKGTLYRNPLKEPFEGTLQRNPWKEPFKGTLQMLKEGYLELEELLLALRTLPSCQGLGEEELEAWKQFGV